MKKWFSKLSPDEQAKIVLGITIALVIVNVFIFAGFLFLIWKVLVV